MDGAPRKMRRKAAGVTAGPNGRVLERPARPGLRPIASRNPHFVRDRVSFRPVDGRNEGTAPVRTSPSRAQAGGEAAMTRCGRDTRALRSSNSCGPSRGRMSHSAACSGPDPRTPCLPRWSHPIAPPRLASPIPGRGRPSVRGQRRPRTGSTRPHPLRALATSAHNRPLPRPIPTPAPAPTLRRWRRPRPRDARCGGSDRARLESCASRSPPPPPRSDGSRPPG